MCDPVKIVYSYTFSIVAEDTLQAINPYCSAYLE
jgi:hypothetical protein